MSRNYKVQTRFLFHTNIKIKIPEDYYTETVFDELYSILEDVNEKYDIVVSNILVDVLTELLESIEKTLEKNATVIFSGILAEKEEAFTEKAEKHNLQKIDRNEKNNWVSLVFKYTK